jgi:hypothetical protein
MAPDGHNPPVRSDDAPWLTFGELRFLETSERFPRRLIEERRIRFVRLGRHAPQSAGTHAEAIGHGSARRPVEDQKAQVPERRLTWASGVGSGRRNRTRVASLEDFGSRSCDVALCRSGSVRAWP